MRQICSLTTVVMRPNFTQTLLLLFMATLTSCTSYQTIATKEKINNTLLASLKTNKKHRFYMASGLEIQIHIDSIKNDTIFGRMRQPNVKGRKIPFTDSFDSINRNVVKIKQRKFNPYLTMGAVAPVIVIAIGAASAGPGDFWVP